MAATSPLTQTQHQDTDSFANAHLLTFNPAAWDAATIEQQFPEMASVYNSTIQHQSNPHLKLLFTTWYSVESSCYVYALGDRALLLNRLLGSSHFGLLNNSNPRSGYLSTEQALKAVAQDGLLITGDRIRREPGTRPLALFKSNLFDYHWLRLDRHPETNKPVWSHKFSGTRPQLVTSPDGPPLRDIKQHVIHHPYFGTYAFVSFFNLPVELGIDISIAANRQERLLPHERVALKRGNGRFMLPQLG